MGCARGFRGEGVAERVIRHLRQPAVGEHQRQVEDRIEPAVLGDHVTGQPRHGRRIKNVPSDVADARLQRAVERSAAAAQHHPRAVPRHEVVSQRLAEPATATGDEAYRARRQTFPRRLDRRPHQPALEPPAATPRHVADRGERRLGENATGGVGGAPGGSVHTGPVSDLGAGLGCCLCTGRDIRLDASPGTSVGASPGPGPGARLGVSLGARLGVSLGARLGAWLGAIDIDQHHRESRQLGGQPSAPCPGARPRSDRCHPRRSHRVAPR